MSLTLRYAARSDRGLIREGNQDSVYAGPRLLAVADGMGGMAAGDVASNIVIGAIAGLDDDVVPSEELVDALRRSVDTANHQLRETVNANPQLEGMGTTLTAMLFSGTRFALVHVGDSRAYLLRGEEFVQVTKDDTYVQMLVDEGRLRPEEASSHPQRSLLTRALDGRDVDPEYSVREGLADDRYLLCSDGLSGVVSAETIEATLRELPDLQQCADRLVQLALKGGGPDNITVIVADVTSGDIREEQPIVGGAAASDRGVSVTLDTSSAAARAAALTQPPVEPPPVEPAESDFAESAPPPRPGARRAGVIAGIAVGILVVGAGLGWAYTQSQYYVGVTSDNMVGVFRGVPGQIAGVSLSTEQLATQRPVGDLTDVVQARVRHGIAAASLANAQEIVAEITNGNPVNPNLIRLCEPRPTPSVDSTDDTHRSPSLSVSCRTH